MHVDLLIRGGRIYDPTHDRHGDVDDLIVHQGRVIAPPTWPDGTRQPLDPARILDVTGDVVMPGGIDMHCHIAGPKVNAARKMRPEDRRRDQPVVRRPGFRSGTLGSVPSTFATGYRYAGLGYTTAFDAAVPPLAARHVHEEFHDTPCLDKGFYALVGNNHYLMEAIARNDPQAVRHFLAWLIGSAKAYAPKLVNPGGVENWKRRARGNVHTLDDAVEGFGITPRQIVASIARASHDLGLPHPVHVHCNNLGVPGNWKTTEQTMEALEGHRGHLTHIQFHSYSGEGESEQGFGSGVEPLAERINQSDTLTVDVGQVLFGETTSMTGDGPLGYYLRQVYGTKWFSADVEMEAGCGIAPITYREKSLVHAWQWAIGLEWYLLVNDPWKIAMSTDHPNGGSFLAYPQIVRLLMDLAYRQDVLARVHPQVRSQTQLAHLDREYSLSDICIITRSGPARMLGLSHKGHLGPGADADITVYTPDENVETMFSVPKYVIKSGQILIDQGELREAPLGSTLYVAPDYDQGRHDEIARWFDRHYSVSFRNYPVDPSEIDSPRPVACQTT